MKRAGLDYVKDLNLYVYETMKSLNKKSWRISFFTRYSHLCYTDQDLAMIKRTLFIFGHEHDGIPKEI